MLSTIVPGYYGLNQELEDRYIKVYEKGNETLFKSYLKDDFIRSLYVKYISTSEY